MWCLLLSGEQNRTYFHYSSSVVARIHWHGWALASVGCCSWGWLLSGPRTHKTIEGWPTLKKCVRSFLDTRVVKIDPWSCHRRSLITWRYWHTAWLGVVALGCSWRRTRHWWARRVLRRTKRAIRVRLGGTSRSNSTAVSLWQSRSAVKQTEDFSLKLLLMTRLSWSTRNSRQKTWRRGSTSRWRRESCRRWWGIKMHSCRSCNVDWSYRRKSVTIWCK